MATVRGRFDKELDRLQQDVLRLGSMARQEIVEAMSALTSGDAELAREVVAKDDATNDLRYDVEKACYRLLATEQPVASDLRAVVAALIIATDLERIADHGKKIAKISLRMTDEPRAMPPGTIPRLAELALEMLDRALKAYAMRDAAEGEAVCLADDQVDALYKQCFNVLLGDMLQSPNAIGASTHLLQVAHELERIGDRATNVAERVIYAVTGDLLELNACICKGLLTNP